MLVRTPYVEEPVRAYKLYRFTGAPSPDTEMRGGFAPGMGASLLPRRIHVGGSYRFFLWPISLFPISFHTRAGHKIG